jgi:hypothetical protein
MRWVICSFKPQVNRMKTDRVEAGEAYSKHKVSAQVSACDATRVRGLERGTRRGLLKRTVDV